MHKHKKILSKLLTWLVISAQILALVTTATVGAIQPTPQMVQEAAQQAGLGDWFANAAGAVTAAGQRLWGTPATALAAPADVSPTSLNFGNINVGALSASQLITVSNLSSAGSAISAGASGNHTCALTSLGGLKCWGAMSMGSWAMATAITVAISTWTAKSLPLGRATILIPNSTWSSPTPPIAAPPPTIS